MNLLSATKPSLVDGVWDELGANEVAEAYLTIKAEPDIEKAFRVVDTRGLAQARRRRELTKKLQIYRSMPTRWKTLVGSALLLPSLTGRATSGTKTPRFYPEIPADLRLCFNSAVAKPKTGPMTKAEVLALVSKLKLSETHEVGCGQRLIAVYDSMSSG